MTKLICSLLSNNYTRIHANHNETDGIAIKCGVPQGGPLSPILFNIAIDYIYKEICDPEFANAYGYCLDSGLDAVCLSGFADDQAVTARSEEGAIRVIEAVEVLFGEIGLIVNPKKSLAINIKAGALAKKDLHLSNDERIHSINYNERIRYLGCSFEQRIVFDEDRVVKTFHEKLDKLTTSPNLKPYQKLNIINQYLFTTLIYPLQAAPIKEIPRTTTEGLDVMIRKAVKDIVGLPTSTATDMFYAPRNVRGLALLRC